MYNNMHNESLEFEWDDLKNVRNILKHDLSFEVAESVFLDNGRIVLPDERHSLDEDRFLCIGETGEGIATVCFTVRKEKIRIISAGYWRKGRRRYERKKRNNLH